MTGELYPLACAAEFHETYNVMLIDPATTLGSCEREYEKNHSIQAAAIGRAWNASHDIDNIRCPAERVSMALRELANLDHVTCGFNIDNTVIVGKAWTKLNHVFKDSLLELLQ